MHFYNRIQAFELDSCISSGELPDDLGASLIAPLDPGTDFVRQCVPITDALVQALHRQDREFALGDIEPTAMFGCVVPFEAGSQSMRFRRRKVLIECARPMNVQIIVTIQAKDQLV